MNSSINCSGISSRGYSIFIFFKLFNGNSFYSRISTVPLFRNFSGFSSRSSYKNKSSCSARNSISSSSIITSRSWSKNSSGNSVSIPKVFWEILQDILGRKILANSSRNICWGFLQMFYWQFIKNSRWKSPLSFTGNFPRCHTRNASSRSYEFIFQEIFFRNSSESYTVNPAKASWEIPDCVASGNLCKTLWESFQ